MLLFLNGTMTLLLFSQPVDCSLEYVFSTGSLEKSCGLRVRLCSICEGRISVLKRWFKTPFTGVLFMLIFFVLEKELISWTCTAHALATLTQEGRSNWGARFLRSFEFRLLFVSELFMHVSTARELELESIIAHCAIFARAGRAHFQVNRKGVYMTSFKRDYMWVAFMLPQNQRFALITFRTHHFVRF